MANNPLCPDCRKQMTPRFICTHCGYDTQRIQTTTHRVVAPMPYECVKCGNRTGKVVDGIPVCGDCFVAGWGRLPDMPLTKGGSGTVPLDTSTEAMGTVTLPAETLGKLEVPKDFPCPKCKRKFTTKTGLGIHRKSKHGGTR